MPFIAYYRAKAEELRTCAEDTIQCPRMRERWYHDALMYERMAKQAIDDKNSVRRLRKEFE